MHYLTYKVVNQAGKEFIVNVNRMKLCTTQESAVTPQPIGTGIRWRPILRDPVVRQALPPQRADTPARDDTPWTAGDNQATDPTWSPAGGARYRAGTPERPSILTRQRAQELAQRLRRGEILEEETEGKTDRKITAQSSNAQPSPPARNIGSPRLAILEGGYDPLQAEVDLLLNMTPRQLRPRR